MPLKERVSTFEGKFPVIIVSPYPNDNINYICCDIIKNLNCYGVINRGWNFSANFNYELNLADCNNLEHLHNDVIQDEFLIPILKYKNRILKKHSKCLFFIFQEIGNYTKILYKDLDIIAGYGNGNPPSYTMELWMKNLFVESLLEGGLNIYEGKSRGLFSARNKKNLCQLFRMSCWHSDKKVNSLHLHITPDLCEPDVKNLTSDFLSQKIKFLSNNKKTNWKSCKRAKLI